MERPSSVPSLRTIIAPLLLGVFTFLAHARSPVLINSDSQWSLYVAQSIVREGNINLDEYRPRIRAMRAYGVRKRDGHLYNFFPLGPSLAALPFVWAYERFPVATTAALPGVPERFNREAGVLGVRRQMERAVASFYVAVAAASMVGALSLLTTTGWALVGGLLFAFGSSAWSVASRGLWQHGPALALITIALWLIVALECRVPLFARWGGIGKGVALSAVGVLLGLAYLTRPTSAVIAATTAALIVWRHRWGILPFACGMAAILLPFVALNLDIYNTFLPPYFRPRRVLHSGSLAEGLLGTLMSPSRGLVIFSPWVLLVPFTARWWWRSHRALMIGAGSTAILIWGVTSSFPIWWGGHSYGPRLLSEAIPSLVLLLAPFPAIVRNLSSRIRRILLLIAAPSLIIISFWIHLRGATSYAGHHWNRYPRDVDSHRERLWSFSDWQVAAR